MSPSRRLKNYDYSGPGLYFVTVCADFKRCLFGEIVRGTVKLTALGRIVNESWIRLPERISGIRLHRHVVMPNHIHGIVEILSIKQAQQAAPLRGVRSTQGEMQRAFPLPIIVRSFKAEVTRRAHLELNWEGEVWQNNFFDRVIRDGREFSNAERYIAENPIRWQAQNERWAEDKALKSKRAQQAAPLRRNEL